MELLESVLLLSAEMDDGLGLLVATRPHGKTAAQLLRRLCFVETSLHEIRRLWGPAARNGHLSVLKWLHDLGRPLGSHKRIWLDTAKAAAEGGHVDVLKWVARFVHVLNFIVGF